MIKMTTQLENIVKAYKTLSGIPSVLGAKLGKNLKINSKWSIRNLDKGKTTKYHYNYALDAKLNVISESDFGIDISNELLSSVSPNDTYKAVIREEKDKDVKKQYLEIWRSNFLTQSVDLTALDIHGDVYADSEFGCLNWSRDESSLVYIAEKKLEKSEPYIKRKAPEDPNKPSANGDKEKKKGEEYIYRQDWGEQLVGKIASVVVVYRLAAETFTIVEGLPASWCPGQVIFSPDGSSVTGVAWETEPRRLGLIFCTNRPSYIFNISLVDNHMSTLSGQGLSVRSPRYNSRGDLFWLQRPAGGPHHACHQLVAIRSGTDKVTTIIDIVQTKKEIEVRSVFHGIYCLALPGRCFSSDDNSIVFSTPQRNEVRTYVVNIDSCNVRDISNKQFVGSTSVLDVRGDVIIAVCSNMTTPGQIFVTRLGQEGDVWSRVSSPIQVPNSVESSQVQYLELKHEDSQDSVNSFTSILFTPKTSEGKMPLIVWPHGGPHSGFVNSFSIEAALYSMLGFASLQVNYRGSTGAGQASVEFLPKRVGDSDVKDCKLATDTVTKQHPVDSNRVFLSGGSHGGFLVTHLSGQYPNTYKAVVTRNPVTDVASMFNSTDIADWCAVEAGYEFSERGAVSEEMLVTMRRCSPLVHVSNVRAPTALLLGTADKRVPYYQGLEYARRLKANGVETRIYLYDDNHSLSSPAAEMDSLINAAYWFIQHSD